MRDEGQGFDDGEDGSPFVGTKAVRQGTLETEREKDEEKEEKGKHSLVGRVPGQRVPSGHLSDRGEMGLGEVDNVDKITNTGSIRGWVVCTIHLIDQDRVRRGSWAQREQDAAHPDNVAFPLEDLGDDGHEVGGICWVLDDTKRLIKQRIWEGRELGTCLPDVARRVGAAGVRIPQRHCEPFRISCRSAPARVGVE